MTGQINRLNSKVEFDSKTIDFREKELVKKRNQLDRLKALEDLFNNGEYEEYQKSKLQKPQSGMVSKKISGDEFKDQSQRSRTYQSRNRSGKFGF